MQLQARNHCGDAAHRSTIPARVFSACAFKITSICLTPHRACLKVWRTLVPHEVDERALGERVVDTPVGQQLLRLALGLQISQRSRAVGRDASDALAF